MKEINSELMEQINKIAGEVMKYSRNTLLVNLRFLDISLSKLKLIQTDLFYMATDGVHFAYNPLLVIKTYREEKEESVRDYLHVLLHCIFCHMFTGVVMNDKAWDLACDIAVENTITDLRLNGLSSQRETGQSVLINSLNGKVRYMTAESMYHYFCEQNFSDEELDEMRRPFIADDHSIWHMPPSDNPFNQSGDESSENGDNQPGDGSSEDNNGQQSEDNKSAGNDGSSGSGQNDSGNSSSIEKEWKDISNRINEDLSTFSKARGERSGSLMQNLRELHREKYDYEAFLKKFSVLGEVMKIDDDEFDYIFYTYGLKLYGKMPLIEPLEYKEAKRIREFVIAIDTSGSVQGELVQRFLQKTFNILKQEESFFRRFNLHIVQCDADIQEDAVISSQEEFEQYIKNMKIRGLGGTDFRPVFEYVGKLIDNHTFVNLKGLIYFTDGYGVFPEYQPPYRTAFVFVDDGMNNLEVPVWAIKLVLPMEEI